jgi:spore coat protein A, manganese oxidase
LKNAIRFGIYFAILITLGSLTQTEAAVKSVAGDFDGDGKTDFVTVRADGDKLVWWISYSNGKSTSASFGSAGDKLVPADYDGDSKTDLAVWRPASATFYVMQSASQTARIEKFGLTGDDPSIVADYDGDGKADLAVYRPGTPDKPQSFFYYRPSSSKTPNDFVMGPWGLLGDDTVVGDYDGDGKADLAVRRSKTADGHSLWYIHRSKEGDLVSQWGLSTDEVAVADYDGDGKTDIAVMRNSNDGAESKWQFYVLNSGDGRMVVKQFGLANNDVCVPGDYDGDGKADVGLWRKTDATFWVLSSNLTGDVRSLKWGNTTDTPISMPRGK